MTILTALRTAATSAVAAKFLAPKGARSMALIGNGAQSEFQAIAFGTIFGVDHIRLFDIDRSATRKCAKNLRQCGVSSTICTSVEEAIESADIITTVITDKKNATILTDNMVGAGVHLNAVGGDCPGKTELDRDILARSKLFVELCAADARRGRDPKFTARLSCNRIMEGDRWARIRAYRCESDHSLRFSRLCDRGFLGASLRPD